VGGTRNVYGSLVVKHKEWQPRRPVHRWEGYIKTVKLSLDIWGVEI
jgi:hypothetical protein